MGVYRGPKTVIDGLVLVFDAANIKSYSGLGTNLTDLSGRGNNGTLVNGVGYTSDNGGSFSFDGSNDYINTGFTYQNSSDFTMSCWMKTSTTQKSGIVGIRTSFGVPNNWYLSQVSISGDKNVGTSGNNIVFSNYYGGGGAGAINRSVFANTVNVTDGNWRYIVASSNSTVSSVYIDAVLVGIGTSTSTTPITRGTAPFIVGAAGSSRTSPAAGLYYTGQISNVCFYSRELSSDEILQNYNTLKGRYGIL
jgi:hypothetical protein